MSLPELPPELKRKFDLLKSNIRSLGSLAVACSGGVDSTFLAVVAHNVLGEKALAVTGADASVPERELEEAKAVCGKFGIRHVVCRLNPLQEEGYRLNGPDRCYFCKRGLFMAVWRIALENGIAHVAEGSNVDDLGDYRPGLRAVAELSVNSPLRDAGLAKADIRLLARSLGLQTWNKPASACLASRLPYGEEITVGKLNRIERAEQFLIDRGFTQRRVRVHGGIARIEVPREDIARLAEEGTRSAVCQEFRRLGFTFVTLDLLGYRTGSMNESLVRQGGNPALETHMEEAAHAHPAGRN
ncbi:MAG: ATP-dependent sacrificial sulfur transferase LarE [Desulfovibrionaceae bacterium]|nr:ATP-dependent sacrificial sulfur transferase LarE [Desulfovibrionaceae bacterium]